MATVLLDVDFTNKQNIVHCSFTSTSSVKYVTGVHEMISFVWYPTSPCSLIIIIIIMLLRIKKYQRDNFIPNYDEYYYICAFEFSQRSTCATPFIQWRHCMNSENTFGIVSVPLIVSYLCRYLYWVCENALAVCVCPQFIEPRESGQQICIKYLRQIATKDRT